VALSLAAFSIAHSTAAVAEALLHKPKSYINVSRFRHQYLLVGQAVQLRRPMATLTQQRGRLEEEWVEEEEDLTSFGNGDALGERLTHRALVGADVQNNVRTSL
jgi:hypothetical protein